MRYFPIFFDLLDRKVIVVGGGEEALCKVRLLLKTNARISVIAPLLHDELASEPRVEWLARQFAPQLLDGAALVYSAAPELNSLVSSEAKARGIPVNVIDGADISTFITPSIVDRDPVIVAIGTEGTAPVLGQGIRARIDAMLPIALGGLAARANALRPRVAREVPLGGRRRSFWNRFFFGSIRDAAIAGDEKSYAHELNAALFDEALPSFGRVSLVGTGPGDPELLTLKAQRKLQEADVIVYDRLIDSGILELARRDAVRIAIDRTQASINAVLIREACGGKHVVHLKAGNGAPMSEEMEVLKANGIAVEIVPGIAAAKAPTRVVPFPTREELGENLLRAVS